MSCILQVVDVGYIPESDPGRGALGHSRSARNLKRSVRPKRRHVKAKKPKRRKQNRIRIPRRRRSRRKRTLWMKFLLQFGDWMGGNCGAGTHWPKGFRRNIGRNIFLYDMRSPTILALVLSGWKGLQGGWGLLIFMDTVPIWSYQNLDSHPWDFGKVSEVGPILGRRWVGPKCPWSEVGVLDQWVWVKLPATGRLPMKTEVNLLGSK